MDWNFRFNINYFIEWYDRKAGGTHDATTYHTKTLKVAIFKNIPFII